MKKTIALFCMLCSLSVFGQDSSKVLTNTEYVKGFALYPIPTRPQLGYRSNLNKRRAFDFKGGYVYTMIPQFNLEFNTIRRHVRNPYVNFYSGFGLTLDGLTPGVQVPLGLEIKPFEKIPNLIIVTEVSPKLTFSFSSAFYSTFQGNVGLIYFRPKKK